MNTHALMYEPSSQSTTWAGLLCATAIFALLVALGKTRIEAPATFVGGTEEAINVDIFEPVTDPAVVPDEPEVVPPTKTEDLFPEERIQTRKPVSKPTRAIARQVLQTTNRGTGLRSSGASTAIYAPRPEYPYEARRQGAIGTGVASLTIDQATGLVTNARMLRTTGKSVLDSSAIKAFSRWRFRPGTARLVQVPVTFTLTGVSL